MIALFASACASSPSENGSSPLAGSSGGSTQASAGGTSGMIGTGGSAGPSTGGGGASESSGGALGSGGSTASGGNGPVDVDTVKMASEMGVGTNIGNTLENTTVWETGWGQPLITEKFIAGLASGGIKTVRVPVAWDTYANNGIIDATKLSRVKEVVGWITAAGMYAVVNIHWDGGWIFNESTEAEPNPDAYTLTPAVKSKFASYWEQISAPFAEMGHGLIFEGMNEEGRYFVNGDPNGQPDYAPLNEMNQLFVTTVRGQAGFNKTRALIIAGFQTDIERTCVSQFETPTDPAGEGKLMLSLHYYTPYTFTLMDEVADWGMPSTTWGTDAEKAELSSLFDKAAAFGASRKTPIFLGEFAVTVGTNFPRVLEDRILWLQSVISGCLSRGMVPVLWDTGAEISREDGAFSSEFQTVMDSLNP